MAKKQDTPKAPQKEQQKQKYQPTERQSAPRDEGRADAVQAQVMEIIGKTGVRGEIMQVLAKVLEGKDRGRIMRRNVKGPIKSNDILLLRDTETEAKPIRGR
ncbi:MAG: 30S ribosomal protein S28e [DPANN group archaeon]|nr:30S ribosomal protein S28e [DPANN group archaeon]